MTSLVLLTSPAMARIAGRFISRLVVPLQGTVTLQSPEWVNDCQGKKSYDGRIVVLSSRYWPRGGGFSTFDTTTGQWKENADRPEVLPSATSSVCLVDGDNLVELARKHFKGASEEEVQAKVEKWAAEQYAKVVAAVKQAYGRNA